MSHLLRGVGDSGFSDLSLDRHQRAMGKMGLNSIVQNRNLQKCRLQEAIKNLEALADRNAVISLVDGEKRLRRKVMLEAERKLVAELMRKY